MGMNGSGIRKSGSVGRSLSQVTRYSLWPSNAFLVQASLVARKKAERTVSGNHSSIRREMIAQKRDHDGAAPRRDAGRSPAKMEPGPFIAPSPRNLQGRA